LFFINFFFLFEKKKLFYSAITSPTPFPTPSSSTSTQTGSTTSAPTETHPTELKPSSSGDKTK